MIGKKKKAEKITKSPSRERNVGVLKSIKGKLMSVLCVVMISLLTVTAVIIALTVSSRFEEDKRQLLSESAKSISHEAELFFERYTTIVEQMATDRNIQNYMATT